MRASSVVLTSALAATLVVLATASARAEPPSSRPPQRDPRNVTAVSEFMATVAKANAQHGGGDREGALETYKRAVEIDPRQALGPFLLGEAYLAGGKLDDAEAWLKRAVQVAGETQPAIASKALLGLATIAERRGKKPEARAAWEAYGEHAKAHPNAGAYPETALARIKVQDRARELETVGRAVRERIQAERDAARAASPTPKK